MEQRTIDFLNDWERDLKRALPLFIEDGDDEMEAFCRLCLNVHSDIEQEIIAARSLRNERLHLYDTIREMGGKLMEVRSRFNQKQSTISDEREVKKGVEVPPCGVDGDGGRL